LGYWLETIYLNVEWCLIFDSLTVSMLLPVMIISALVQLYSLGYMSADPAICFGKTLIGNKLSNSGEVLKFMIPSFHRKVICGWSNYPCMVTIHKIDENQIDDRGSKSKLIILVSF
jgi:hypothetical protein